MFKRWLVIPLLLASVGTAMGASQLITETATSTTTTAAYAIAIGQNRAKPVLQSITITADDPLADVVIMDGNGTTTVTSAASSASATSVGVASCTGLNEATYVVITNTNGDTAEVVTVTACTSSSLKGTITNAYRTGAKIWEIDNLWSYSNVGTGTQVIARDLIGYEEGPIVGKITAATGTATIDITVDYR